MRQLYGYQKEAVRYIRTHPNAAIFMAMRLGKSLCTIRALSKFSGRKLIVCPKSVINTWIDEFELEGITDYATYTSPTLKTFRILRYHPPTWLIMNYEAIMRLEPEVLELFEAVILDESVRIKDPRTKTSKFFLQNFRDVKRRIVLTGNPAPNTPLEYYNQFKFLNNEWLECDNYYKFRHRFFSSDLMGHQFWTRNSSKEVLQRAINEDAFILTRKQAGVENKKVYSKRMVQMPPTLRRHYNDMLEEFFVNLPKGDKLETKYVLPQLSYLQQIASGHIKKQEISDFKIKELVELVQGELKGQQIIIWSYFTWEIERIYAALKSLKLKVGRISGITPLSTRKMVQAEFQRGLLKYLVMQVGTGKYGLNLSNASTSIYFSNSLKPDDRTQSEYRIEINGKEESLLYVDILTENSVDESIHKALKEKRENAKYFLGDVVDNLRKQWERVA